MTSFLNKLLRYNLFRAVIDFRIVHKDYLFFMQHDYNYTKSRSFNLSAYS